MAGGVPPCPLPLGLTRVCGVPCARGLGRCPAAMACQRSTKLNLLRLAVLLVVALAGIKFLLRDR